MYAAQGRTQTNHSIEDSTGEYTKLSTKSNYNDGRLFKLSRPKSQRNFHSPLGVRRTVKSSTAAVVAGSLHPDEKPLSVELRRYHGLGVDVALLQLGFDVADLD